MLDRLNDMTARALIFVLERGAVLVFSAILGAVLGLTAVGAISVARDIWRTIAPEVCP